MTFRLQVVPPVAVLSFSSPSLTGGTSLLLAQRKSPRVTPRAPARFVLISLRYSWPLTRNVPRDVSRRDVLGGLVHEYHRAAA